MASVINKKEVSINGIKYAIADTMTSQLASVYPAKIVIGDTTKDSRLRASVLSVTDLRGGIGKFQYDGAADIDRVWFSTAQIRFKSNMVLGALAVKTAASGESGKFGIDTIGQLANAIYATYGTKVFKYTNSTDSWGSSLATLAGSPTDMITIRLDGTVYLLIAYGTGYAFTTDGTTYTASTKDVKYWAFWDDRLWGIDSTGQLWWTREPGTEEDEAQLPLEDNSVTSLIVGFPGTGTAGQVLFAGTKRGLYVHNVDETKFEATGLVLTHPEGGLGATLWRESIYYPNGNAIYKYTTGASGATVSTMGLDRDDGLPQEKRGAIVKLLSTTNELLACVDSATQTDSRTLFTGNAMGEFRSGGVSNVVSRFGSETGFSLIAGYDEIGWEVKWLSDSSVEGIDTAFIGDAYGKYRLYWSNSQRVFFMTLPDNIINPNEVNDFDYAAASELETPWFDAAQQDVTKLALVVKADARDLSATETLVVAFEIDFSGSYTIMDSVYSTNATETTGLLTADGEAAYVFPSLALPEGLAFKFIRFRVQFARGSTSVRVTPKLKSLVLEYRKKLPPRFGYTFTLDLRSRHNNLTPKAQRAALLTAIESDELVEFTFRDDEEDDLTRRYWVDVLSATGVEETGHDESGISRVVVGEP